MPTTRERITAILKETYGGGTMVDALIATAAERIDKWPDSPFGASRGREYTVMMTCWDFFGGGTTADGVARKIEAALGPDGSER